MPVTDAVASLSTNPYFSAGAGLFGVGVAAAVARRASQVIFYLIIMLALASGPANHHLDHQLRDRWVG